MGGSHSKPDQSVLPCESTTATEEEKKKIEDIKKEYTAGKGRNAAFCVGTIGNDKINLESISGVVTPENKNQKGNFEIPPDEHFNPGQESGKADTEKKIFEFLYNKYKDNPQIEGEITLVSEREFCEDCQGVADQFEKFFPNIKVTRVHCK